MLQGGFITGGPNPNVVTVCLSVYLSELFLLRNVVQSSERYYNKNECNIKNKVFSNTTLLALCRLRLTFIAMLDPDTAQSEKISEVHAFISVVLFASHPSLSTRLSSFCAVLRPA